MSHNNRFVYKPVGRRQQYRQLAEAVKHFFSEVKKECNQRHSITSVFNIKSDQEWNLCNRSNFHINYSNNSNELFSTQQTVSNLPTNLDSIFELTETADLSQDISIIPCHAESPAVHTLSEELRKWAVEFHVSHSAINSLLHKLSSYNLELPLNSKTLLRTPVAINLEKLESGDFCYLGITKTLKQIVSSNKQCDTIKLKFNVDGIPLFSSRNLQLWPILAQIQNFNSPPFTVALFCGTSKPKPLEKYLENFISELTDLLKIGFEHEQKKYIVIVHSFICDAPARAFLKCIKGHGGYSSCEKCLEPGEYFKGRIVMKNILAPKRTDLSFAAQSDDDHHLSTSPLLQISSLGLVSQFPIDYMHNVCLGVVRKLIHALMSGPLEVRLCSRSILSMSESLISFRKYVPSEFNRKPRGFDELSRWKATELRTFLLYIAPVLLKKYVDIAIYEHFLLLHSAVTILVSDKHISTFGCTFAGDLLSVFVQHCEFIYGKEFLIHNVHMLSHLSDDAALYGSLDNFSSFPFENYLGHLKRLIKAPTKPLQQIFRRLHEIHDAQYERNTSFLEDFEVKYEHNNGPLLKNMTLHCRQYKQLMYKDCTFSLFSHSPSNSYFLTNNSQIIQIQNIILNRKNEVNIIGKKFLSYESLYTYPICSKMLQIYTLKTLSAELEVWEVNSIKAKCMVLPYSCNNQSCWASFPLVHTFKE